MLQPDPYKLIPAKDASVRVGYTADYVSKLARAGNIVAEQKEGKWFVDLDSLKLFSLQKEAEQKQRGEQIRLDRLRDLSLNRLAAFDEQHIQNNRQGAIVPVFLSIALCACIFFVGGLGVLSHNAKLDVASLAVGIEEVSAALAKLVRTDFVPSDTAATAASSAAIGIVIGEEVFTEREIEKIKNSFSDPVVVTKTTNSTGIITPVFSDSNLKDEYHFVLVPVQEQPEIDKEVSP